MCETCKGLWNKVAAAHLTFETLIHGTVGGEHIRKDVCGLNSSTHLNWPQPENGIETDDGVSKQNKNVQRCAQKPLHMFWNSAMGQSRDIFQCELDLTYKDVCAQ